MNLSRLVGATLRSPEGVIFDVMSVRFKNKYVLIQESAPLGGKLLACPIEKLLDWEVVRPVTTWELKSSVAEEVAK